MMLQVLLDFEKGSLAQIDAGAAKNPGQSFAPGQKNVLAVSTSSYLHDERSILFSVFNVCGEPVSNR